MRALDHKLLRDVRGSAGILLTVVAIIAVGTGSFTGLRGVQRILHSSQQAYYRQYRFADFWIDVKKAPLPAVQRIAALPGVAAIEARVVFDVILDVPGVDEPLTGRLISVPPRGFASAINGIHLVRGSGFSDDRDDQIILGEAFARAHGLAPGQSVDLILNRKRESFRIVGTAISPEYVYLVPQTGGFAPDPRHFGILYIKAGYAREVLGFQDAANQVVGQLVPGYEQGVEFLLERIDRMLAPYGVLATTPRERQASHRFLSDEIRGLGVTAWIMPTIFLFVAALVLNILMSRFSQRQRTVIGTLKAIGYSDRQVVEHFLSFGVIVGVAGGLAGVALGLALSRAMMQMYTGFFEFPTFVFHAYPDLLGLGMLISVGFAIAGTVKGVWAVLRLHPAEAMRPRPPERGGSIFLERFGFLWRRLGFRTHIALRSLVRSRARTITSVLAATLATAIIFTTLAFRDATWFMVDFQFDRIAHSDVDVGLRDEHNQQALFEALALPGVRYAEPVFALVCDLRNGRQSRRLAVTGLGSGHRLTTPVQADLREVRIPPAGLVLADKLAEVLGVRDGDWLELTPVRGRQQTHRVPVASVVKLYLGLECYADLRYLGRLVGETFALNAVQLEVDPARINELYRTVKQLPNVQGIGVRTQVRQNIEDTLLATMGFSLTLMILFAGIISFGSMLNSSLIEIADRTRDIATFRVLGYQPHRVAGIFLRENLMVFALGLVFGIPTGIGLVYLTAWAYDTELFRMPVIIRGHVMVLAAGLAAVFVALAQVFVYRQVRALDWLEGVQIKE